MMIKEKHKIKMTCKEDGIAKIIVANGGEVIGRNRLRYIAALAAKSGGMKDYRFCYFHGPHSDDFDEALDLGTHFGAIDTKEFITEWGARYDAFSLGDDVEVEGALDEQTSQLVRVAAQADSVVLGLAARAAYLAEAAAFSVWREVEMEEPIRAKDGRLERAKKLYEKLRAVAPTLPEA
jgi:hypothetical protein